MNNQLFVVGTFSLKSAERNGGGKAYLARLTSGPSGDVRREFVKARKATNGSKSLSSNARPGDVFEARRWRWDASRSQYSGGTIWFGVQGDGSLFMLTREEAFNAVGATAISTTHRPTLPDVRRPSVMVPDDLYCSPLENSEVERIIDASET